MSKWSDFYGTRAHNYIGYKEYCKIRYAPFIDTILTISDDEDGDRSGFLAGEIGCGLGTISGILIDCRPDDLFCASDIDTDMLKLANIIHPCLDAFAHDARKPLKKVMAGIDIVYSHGLLEHFSNEDIRKIISINNNSHQVHYVPGLYETPSFGDERLMCVDEWRGICAPDEVHTFNEGLDYTLIFHPKK